MSPKKILYFYHPMRYTPWGEEFKSDIVTPNSWDSPYRFNGKELDEETGLYYYGARYYNPSISVWLSVDPLSKRYPNLTTYNFSGNNPILFIDPDGEKIIIPNSKDRAAILEMINSKAMGVFGINDDTGELYVIKKDGARRFSQTYRNSLIAAINDDDIIEVSINQTYEENGVTKDVDADAGGGVAILSTETITDENSGDTKTVNKAQIIISGNENKNLFDTEGNSLEDKPADILIHEFVGHAIPFIHHPNTGNAVENENQVRAEIGLDPNPCLRKAEPNHDEF